MKVFNGILGAFSIFAAFYCLLFPGKTFLSAGWILTILLCVWGFCALIELFTKKGDQPNKKTMTVNAILALIGGIVAAIASIVVMVNPKLSLITDAIIVYVFVFWLIFSGITSIIGAVTVGRQAGNKLWIFTLIWGILCVLGGMYGIVHIYVMAWTIGLMFGIELLLYGTRLIASIFE